MLKDVKLGFKLLKYSYNFKTSMILTIIIFVLGLLLMMIEPDTFVLFGLYSFIGVLIIVQMSTSLLYAQMFSASPKKKKLELTFSNAVTTAGAVIWYLFLTVLSQVFSYFRPQLRGEYNVALIVIGIFMMICIIYYGACYKYFIVASIIFGITFGIVYSIGRTRLTIILMEQIGADFAVSFTIGLVIILISSGIACVMRRLLYKKPLSPNGMGANLRKAMC
ncbi:MAG: hypothetical protein IJX63_03945 [Lachnospiraceae bacterium]|nr:hypothetical protein [Lachnospiraceae bacterium]